MLRRGMAEGSNVVRCRNSLVPACSTAVHRSVSRRGTSVQMMPPSARAGKCVLPPAMATAGRSALRSVMDRMGHSLIQTTQKYLHPLPDAGQCNLDAFRRIAGPKNRLE